MDCLLREEGEVQKVHICFHLIVRKMCKFFIAMTYVFKERWVNPDLNLFPLILSLALRLLYPITFTYFLFVETDIFSPYLCSFIQPLFHVAVYLSIHPFNLFFHIY